MHPAQGIGRLGFRRWYERQLIEAHVYLVTCFLCMVLVAIFLEDFSFRAPGLKPVLTLALLLGCAALGVHAWTRFRRIMLRAEGVAHRATCESCQTYGRFTVVVSGATAPDEPDAEPAPWMKVACRKCGHAWTIG